MENIGKVPIKIGVSACLLGQEVRWNGGHKLDRFLVHTLGRFVQRIAVCPEVECGLGIPRETMRLVGQFESPCLLTTETGIDHTARMKKWARQRTKELAGDSLCGFIFKSKSPAAGCSR